MSLLPIPNGLVVLTFDDGNKSDFTYVAPLLKQYGFGATFYITEGLKIVTNKQHYLTWEEVQQLHQSGFEIGNHTRHHTHVSEQTQEEFLADLEYINARFQQYKDGKIAVLTFHGVPALEHPWVNTHPDDFKVYMDFLNDHGFTVIALRDLSKYVEFKDGA